MKTKSNRNRHTGRVNSAKQIVLDRGERVQANDGVVYIVYRHNDPVTGFAKGIQFVRDFAAISLRR